MDLGPGRKGSAGFRAQIKTRDGETCGQQAFCQRGTDQTQADHADGVACLDHAFTP